MKLEHQMTENERMSSKLKQHGEETERLTKAAELMRQELEQLKAETAEYRAAKLQSQQTKPTPYVQKQYKDGTYFGEMNEEGKRHGRGVFKWKDGYLFFGEWKNDIRRGKGVFIGEEGIYEGEWLNGQVREECFIWSKIVR